MDGCICFTRKIQHGCDWERSRPQGPKNVHNFLLTVRPLSWACGHGTEMLLIQKKTFFDLITPRGRISICILDGKGGGPRVVVSTAAFHARVRGSVPGLGGLKETKLFLPHPRVKVSIVGSLRDREVACSASDRQGSNFESCVWRTVSSQSSHHPQEVLLAQFSLYVHKGGLKPDSFHFYSPIFSDMTVQRNVSRFHTRSICGWNLFQPLGLAILVLMWDII